MNAKDDPHFGLMLAATVNGLAVGSYREMVVVSQTAEEYGFDSVWLCDHFLTISPGEYAKVAGIAADTGSATGTETGGAGPFTVAGLPRVAQGILILFFATGFPAQRIHQGAGRIMSS